MLGQSSEAGSLSRSNLGGPYEKVGLMVFVRVGVLGSILRSPILGNYHFIQSLGVGVSGLMSIKVETTWRVRGT